MFQKPVLFLTAAIALAIGGQALACDMPRPGGVEIGADLAAFYKKFPVARAVCSASFKAGAEGCEFSAADGWRYTLTPGFEIQEEGGRTIPQSGEVLRKAVVPGSWPLPFGLIASDRLEAAQGKLRARGFLVDAHYADGKYYVQFKAGRDDCWQIFHWLEFDESGAMIGVFERTNTDD